jgi:hypothetical protein
MHAILPDPDCHPVNRFVFDIVFSDIVSRRSAGIHSCQPYRESCCKTGPDGRKGVPFLPPDEGSGVQAG